MDKQQRKAMVKRWAQAQRADVVAAMPIPPERLHQLLDYLDARLTCCDHTTRLTEVFLRGADLDTDRVLSWLGEHGGYCDCEVLANLDDLDQSLNAPPAAASTRTKPKPMLTPRDLRTSTGWDLSSLPSPWRIANLYVPADPMRLQLGKKDECSMAIVESPLPAGDSMSDEYWSGLWHARTQLPHRGEMQVTHGALSLPQGFRSTLVRCSEWTPVYCWIVPEAKSWHLEVRTEWNRAASDWPQVGVLICHLARGEV